MGLANVGSNNHAKADPASPEGLALTELEILLETDAETEALTLALGEALTEAEGDALTLLLTEADGLAETDALVEADAEPTATPNTGAIRQGTYSTRWTKPNPPPIVVGA